ncbi:uncharacterized protein LOC144466975 isoform X2 [Epinephelus lanceolatus]
MFAGYGGPSSAEASVTAPALILGWKGRQEEERPAAAALYEDGTVGATGGEFELQVAMFEEVLCVAVLFIDVDPIIRCSLFRRFTRPSSLLGSSKITSYLPACLFDPLPLSQPAKPKTVFCFPATSFHPLDFPLQPHSLS